MKILRWNFEAEDQSWTDTLKGFWIIKDNITKKGFHTGKTFKGIYLEVY
jgi:hypothetical protein